MVKVITPIGEDEENRTTVFLAGPIQGAKNWQNEAIRIISSNIQGVTIANPRKNFVDANFVYERQVDWETKYLNKAAKDGVILFWLAKEYEHNCRRAYAQTTRFELAEWKARHEHNKNINIVLGIEDEFSNKRYIERRFAQDCPEIKIFNTLQNTCYEVIEILKRKG